MATSWMLDVAYILLALSVAYALLCLLAGFSSTFQRALIYCHWVKFPILNRSMRRVRLHELRGFGLQHCVRNGKLPTSDGEELGYWHFAPTVLGPSLSALANDESARDKLFDEGLADASQTVVLLLHGMGGTRGLHNRTETCRALAAQLQCHVLMIDYRGFGDSSGSPSEDGLKTDALAAWEWLGRRRSAGAFVYGQSLGAAVAVKFCAALAAAGGPDEARLLGAVLDVPFASLTSALLHNPLALPFRVLPCVHALLVRALYDRWQIDEVIKTVRCPLLTIGAGRDRIVGPDGYGALAAAAAGARAKAGVDVVRPSDAWRVFVWALLIESAGHDDTWTFEEWLLVVSKFLRLEFSALSDACVACEARGCKPGPPAPPRAAQKVRRAYRCEDSSGSSSCSDA